MTNIIYAAINIPSGKLVIGGNPMVWLYDDFKEGDEGCYQTFRAREKRRLEHFAQQGIVVGLMGNNCPAVMFSGTEKAPVITLAEDATDVPGEKFGTIFTDSSDYFIVDEDDYLARFAKNQPDWPGGEILTNRVRVEVPAGRYVLEQFYGFQQPWQGVYARLTRSDEPLPKVVLPEETLETALRNQGLPNKCDYYRITLDPEKNVYTVTVRLPTSCGEYGFSDFTVPENKVKDTAFLVLCVQEAQRQAEEEATRLKNIDKLLAERKREDPEGFKAMLLAISNGLEGLPK